MATEELGNLKIVEETPPKTPTEQEPKKKRPGPCNPDQATEFVLQTMQSVDRFMSKKKHESDAIKEGYQVLIAEYHHSLCDIIDYFKQADRKLVLELIDDTTCKLLRTTTPKDAADKEKCPDPRVSTENLMTGHRALNRLAALPNFKDIEGADREEVCELFDSLQTALAAIADAAGSLASLGQRLHPHQFQFLLKHSICPLIQLQIPVHLCHPGELRFEKQYLSSDERYKQCCVNILSPRPYHPALDSIPPKHPTRALAAAIHYHLWKKCAQNLMPHRLRLLIYSKSRERSFLHPSQDVNTTLVRNQPNQKSLNHLSRKTHQQKNKQKNHSHHNQLHLR